APIWPWRSLGGGSLLPGGSCFRAPEQVLASRTAVGPRGFSAKRMEPLFERVEREINVSTTPEDLRSGSTELFVEGARKLGVDMHSMRRNTKDCQGAGRCTLGCPNEAKRSVDITYLRKATAHGTKIYSDCIVERILIRGSRAV